MSLQLFVILPYLFLLFVGLTIPSDGQHGILNPKSLAFVLSAVSIALSQIYQGKMTVRQWNLTAFFSLALVFLITWLILGMAQGETPFNLAFDQLKVFVITLSVPIMTAFLIEDNFLTPNQFYRAVIYSSFIYIAIKCLLVTLHLLGVINIWSLINFAGFRAMNMSITEGLNRLQTSSDVFTPFLVFFVLQADRLKVSLPSIFRLSYLFLAFLSTLLSFSRYLIAIYMICFVLYWFTINAKKTILNLLLALTFLGAGLYFVGPAKVQKIVELRVFSTNTYISDAIRKSQVRALFDEIEEAPLLGHGLGAYAKANIRDSKLKYSYEVQWVALLMQFGIIGLTIFILPLIYMGYQILNAPPSTTRIAFFILFLLWILSGLTNPFLLSLASGILYTCFYMLPEALNSSCDKRLPSLTIQPKPK